MKVVNAALKTAIRNGYSLEAVPKLTAEWNMNRYYSPTTDNVPSEDSEGLDIEMFPIESIVLPQRPTKGISKGRIGESTTGRGYDNDKGRYYIGSVDDVYKYWSSPISTDSSGTFPNHTDGVSKVRPFVIYNENIIVNKIVIKLDNYWASPSQFFVKTTMASTPGNSDWETVSTSPVISLEGTITLYWNGFAWTQTKPASMVAPPLTAIRGVMLQVNSMGPGRDRKDRVSSYRQLQDSETTPYLTVPTTGADSYFNLIEISARREVDISDRLIKVDDKFDMSDVSELYPIGTLTSNTASITLSNLYNDSNGDPKNGYFNRDNLTGPYKDILEQNVQFTLEYVFDLNGTSNSVQQFKMYGNEWGGLVSDEATVELEDFSKFFNEMYPRPALYEGLTVPEIIQRVLDSVGFVDWIIEDSNNEIKHIIPNFWVDGEKNVWEILDDIAKGTQTAIYFDSLGLLRVKTRKDAFQSAKTPDWTLRAVTSGSELPDIVSLSQDDELGANHLTVTYKNTEWSKEVRGMPAMQKVWEPDTTAVVLRASHLTQNITDETQYVHIPPQEAALWPWSGMFEIEGEIFRYDGKRFVYYTYTETTATNGNVTYSNPVRRYVTVNSEDEHKDFNQRTPFAYRSKNHFTGGLVLDTTEPRGVWNSEQRDHSVDINGWVTQRTIGGNKQTNAPGVSHRKESSCMRIRNLGNSGTNDLITANHGTVSGDPYKFFGTQVTFLKEKGLTDQTAGFVINHTSSKDDGYYVQLQPTNNIDNKDRKSKSEVTLFSRVNGNMKKIGDAHYAVVAGIEYDIDAQIKVQGSNHRIIVWVNGKKCLDEVISGSDKNDMSGQFALFVMGKSAADFQYFYAIRREVVDPDDDASFFNLKEGGYTGAFWDREWVWGWKTITRRKKKKSVKERVRWGMQFFDEFGPIVHEVREFDVKFDPNPVLHSRLYMSNEWTAICTEYRSTPFGAYFVLANAARENAVVLGEDSLVLDGGQASTSVNQVLTAIGRVLVVSDAETVIAKDDDAIRVRGKIEAELESDWIQSKKMAQDISRWMKNHWSQGLDQLTVEIFGNPLIEICDIVNIDYPEKFMTVDTHKYFVTGIETSFDTGIKTTMTLRRVS